jgi:tRNA (guanine10-N2)-dimethyltransferase
LPRGKHSGSVLILLSGEHPTLPYSETFAILEAEGIGYELLSKNDQVLILRTDNPIGEAIQGRAAFATEGGKFVLRTDVSKQKLIKNCDETDWDFLDGRSFGVKVTRVKDYSRALDTMFAQKAVGESVISCTDSRVDLGKPEVWIRGVITDGGFFIYEKEFERDKGSFSSRKPKTRPFFHPGVLDPKLSRAFVNLSRVRRGVIFVDPFCGTGGFLIEAAMIGCRACGIDLDSRMIIGASRNLRHYGMDADFIHSDAGSMPLDSAYGIATDPPYGRGTSTMGGGVGDILRRFFVEARRVLEPGRYVCTAAPIELKPAEIAKNAGLKVQEEHSMRVHKSLTRSIIVAERM